MGSSFKIGYYVKEENYIIVGKLPEKQAKQVKNEKIEAVFGKISKKLQEMYSHNMDAYSRLKNISAKTG